MVQPLMTDPRGRPPMRVSADSPAGPNVDKVTVDREEIQHGTLADEINGYVEYFVSTDINHPQFLVTARRTGYVVITFREA